MTERYFATTKDCSLLLEQIGEASFDGKQVIVLKSQLSDAQIQSLIDGHDPTPPVHPWRQDYLTLKQAEANWGSLSNAQKDAAIRRAVQFVLGLIKREVNE